MPSIHDDSLAMARRILCKGSMADILAAFGAGSLGVNGHRQAPIHPLAAAATSGRTLIAKYLIEKGADVDVRVLRDAQVQRKADTEQLLVATKGRSPLHCAVTHGTLGVVRVLLEAGADANAEDAKVVTPLCLAVVRPSTPEFSKEMLKAGADPELVTRKERVIPLHRAVKSDGGSTEMISILLSAAPDAINFQTKAGEIPLLLAAARGNGDAVLSLLLKENALHSELSVPTRPSGDARPRERSAGPDDAWDARDRRRAGCYHRPDSGDGPSQPGHPAAAARNERSRPGASCELGNISRPRLSFAALLCSGVRLCGLGAHPSSSRGYRGECFDLNNPAPIP